MKNLYLVRHGESKLNAKRVHQDGTVGLSEKGIEQSKQLAKRITAIPIDIVLASPFERAKQTADIIGQRLNLPIELNPLLVEIKRPTEIEGRQVDEPGVVAIKNEILANWNNPAFKHSDEETFYEFKNRASEVIKLLTQLNNEHILVVTHGDLIGMIICLMAFGEGLEPETLKKFRKFLMLSNTGITVCKFENEQWKLITWNDITHIPV